MDGSDYNGLNRNNDNMTATDNSDDLDYYIDYENENFYIKPERIIDFSLIEEHEEPRSVFKVVLQVVMKRCIELLSFTIFFSVIATTCNLTGVITERFLLVLLLVILDILLLFINIKRTRNCYYELCDSMMHYTGNILGYMLFVLINLLGHMLLPADLYTWCFALTRTLHYVGIAEQYSFLLFHFLGFVSTMAAPIGMSWVFFDIDEADI